MADTACMGSASRARSDTRRQPRIRTGSRTQNRHSQSSSPSPRTGRRSSQRAKVPVIVAGEAVECERVFGHRGEHGARSFIWLDLKSITVGAAADFESFAAADEVIITRIEREQDANAAVRIGV